MSSNFNHIIATLLDRFHLTLDEIGDLTDVQIHRLYFYPRRKKNGDLEAPTEPLKRVSRRVKEEPPVQAPIQEAPKQSPDEYWDSMRILFDARNNHMIDQEGFLKAERAVNIKFGRIQPSQDDNIKKLEALHQAGTINKEQLDEAIKRLSAI